MAPTALGILGVEVGLLTSHIGVLYATVAAFWFGAGIAALIEPAHATRNASVIAMAITALAVLYLAVASTRPAPPGTSYGGPNVLPPVQALP
jgi:hypothetical protein